MAACWVLEVHPGDDEVRMATVKPPTGAFKRNDKTPFVTEV